MRLFIAFNLDEHKRHFMDLQNKIKKDNAKLSFTDSYHLTLKFLGEYENNKVKELIQRLSMIGFKKIAFNLLDADYFEDREGVSVIWQGVGPQEEIKKLKKKIDTALKPDFKDDFNFHPHITLARVRHIDDMKKLIDNIESIKIEPKEVVVDSFQLIQSNITREGVSYKVLHSFKAK